MKNYKILFNNHPIFKRILLVVFGNSFISVCNFTANLLIVRALSAIDFGLYSYYLLLLRRISQLLDFSSVELLLFSKKRNLKKNEIFNTFITFQIIKTAIIIIGILFINFFNFFNFPIYVILMTLIYVEIRFFILNGITNFYEVFFGTKRAQLINTFFVLFILAALFLLSFLTNFNISLIIFTLSSISTVYIAFFFIFFNDGVIKFNLSFDVIKSFFKDSIFLQINICFSSILKILQDSLVIITLGGINYALYILSNMIGSGISILTKSILRPLIPFFWRVENNQKFLKYIIYSSALMYFSSTVIGIFLSDTIEYFIIQINSDYKNISEIILWSLLFGSATATSQLVVSLLNGNRLIKFTSIMSSIYSFTSTILSLVLYFLFMSNKFIIDLLILNFLLTTFFSILLILLFKLKFCFYD